MKPIGLSADDVKAVLDGRKTMMRQVMKPQPVRNGAFWELGGAGWSGNTVTPVYGHSLYNRMLYKPGDVLWVREKWRTVDYEYHDCKWSASIEYADGSKGLRVFWYNNTDLGIPDDCIYSKTGWQPPRHMPREAARLFLRVKDVRVERVQDIAEKDAESEGFRTECGPLTSCPTCNVSEFSKTWDARNTKSGYGWDSNPWVWVYEFERVERGAEL